MHLRLFINNITGYKDFVINGISFNDEEMWIYCTENVKKRIEQYINEHNKQNIIIDNNDIVHLRTKSVIVKRQDSTKIFIHDEGIL